MDWYSRRLFGRSCIDNAEEELSKGIKGFNDGSLNMTIIANNTFILKLVVSISGAGREC